MNRTIKDATVKRFHYDSHNQLRQHLVDFVAAYNYNFARRLKTFKGLTPYEHICKCWTSEPELRIARHPTGFERPEALSSLLSEPPAVKDFERGRRVVHGRGPRVRRRARHEAGGVGRVGGTGGQPGRRRSPRGLGAEVGSGLAQ